MSLECVYHPIHGLLVVDGFEAERLLSTGVWFDEPAKAQAYRDKVEQEIIEEDREAACESLEESATESVSCDTVSEEQDECLNEPAAKPKRVRKPKGE